MQHRRKMTKLNQLCNGPGKLTQALGITINHNGLDITAPPLYIANGEIVSEAKIKSSVRIGITKSADLELRFFLKDNPFVSRARLT